MAEKECRTICRTPINKHVHPRLFVGSLSKEVNEKEVRALFSIFGYIIDCYVNPMKNFAFLRLDSREGAFRAQETLDGMQIHGKAIRVRRAPHNACIWVGSLPSAVSNELLADAFSQFGKVERAIVICDQRGRSKGYGFVEFARKSSFQKAIKQCSTEFFLLTRSMKPVRVEAWEYIEDETGLEEKALFGCPGISIQLSVPPRFARPGDLEYTYAQKWRALFQEEKRLKRELRAKMSRKRYLLEQEEVHILQRIIPSNLIKKELQRKYMSGSSCSSCVEWNLEEQQLYLQQARLGLGGKTCSSFEIWTTSSSLSPGLNTIEFGDFDESGDVILRDDGGGGGGGDNESRIICDYPIQRSSPKFELWTGSPLSRGLRSVGLGDAGEGDDDAGKIEGESGDQALDKALHRLLYSRLGYSGFRSLRPGKGYPRDRLAALKDPASTRLYNNFTMSSATKEESDYAQRDLGV